MGYLIQNLFFPDMNVPSSSLKYDVKVAQKRKHYVFIAWHQNLIKTFLGSKYFRVRQKNQMPRIKNNIMTKK